jgi:hypothetical protein
MKTSEVDLGHAVVEWLKEAYPLWEVYQEVRLGGQGGSIADIVAVLREPFLVWVIECKLSLSLTLLDQAYKWTQEAHFISIAVPKSRTQNRWRQFHDGRNRITQRIMNLYGIGYIKVGNKDKPYIDSVKEIEPASLHRHKDHWRWLQDQWKGILQDEHKTYATAGSKNLYWTPFKQTCDRLRYHVKTNPGCSIKEAMTSIDHHYSSATTAVSSMRQWLSKGIVKGIRQEWDGKRIRLYAEDIHE